MNLLLDFESTHGEKYYQQSKRSMYYQNCLEDIKNAEKNNKIRKTLLEENDMYWPQFRGYLFNTGTGLASLWSNIHLKDQIKHSKEKPYLEWSLAFSDKACVLILEERKILLKYIKKQRNILLWQTTSKE